MHQPSLAQEILKENSDLDILTFDQTFYKDEAFNGINLIRQEYPIDQLIIFSLLPMRELHKTAYLLKNGFSDVITIPLDKENFIAKVTQHCETLDAITQAKEAAVTDFLTKLYNRRYFFEEGNHLLESAKRGAIRLSLGMIDVDHFKQINDEYGHQVGDLALKYVSNAIRQNFRKADLISRIGGEEFAILAINADGEMGYQLFDRLRQNIEKNPLSVNDKTINITVSIGLTHVVEDDLLMMLHTADESLNKAKSAGKNRTIVH
jgi:diguanylate cyclase (GGDEF)-like protein